MTGSTGFVGQHLIHRLSEFYDIDTLDRDPHAGRYSWIDFGDIDFSEYQTVIHLAGLAHDTSSKVEERHYFDVNFGLTKKIFSAAEQSKVEKFIFLSTIKVLADSESEALHEDMIPKPQSVYGDSKLKAENHLLDNVKDTETGVYILRPCLVFGAPFKGNLATLAKFIRRGIPIPFGALSNERHYLDIRNLAFVIDKIMSEKVDSGVYHVADDTPLTNITLSSAIASKLGKHVKFLNIPVGLMKSVFKLSGFLGLSFNSRTFSKFSTNLLVSNTKIKKALGIEYMPYAVIR